MTGLPVLRYECERGCGACCKHLIIEIDELDIIREPKLKVAQPFTQDPRLQLVDEDTEEPYVEQVPGYGAGAMLACGDTHPCPFLGPDNDCQIYPTRPNCCVAFRAGSEKCQEARQAFGLPELQPCVS